jgi:hypothetical protein
MMIIMMMMIIIIILVIIIVIVILITILIIIIIIIIIIINKTPCPTLIERGEGRQVGSAEDAALAHGVGGARPALRAHVVQQGPHHDRPVLLHDERNIVIIIAVGVAGIISSSSISISIIIIISSIITTIIIRVVVMMTTATAPLVKPSPSTPFLLPFFSSTLLLLNIPLTSDGSGSSAFLSQAKGICIIIIIIIITTTTTIIISIIVMMTTKTPHNRQPITTNPERPPYLRRLGQQHVPVPGEGPMQLTAVQALVPRHELRHEQVQRRPATIRVVRPAVEETR